MKSYNEILSDVTKTATKIPQSDYLDTGKYRIFDQGKEYSVGFSNDEQGVVSDYPYIIFGDHTRVVKYVNEPCFIGADGVKLLKVINKDFNPRFVYYNILAKPIENQGYARHFKFLKEIQFTEKTLSVQTNIVTELDTIQSAIDNKKQQLSLLDEAVKSRFIEMFGDILAGKYKFETRKLGEISEVGSSHRVFTTEFVEHGIPFYRGTEIGELANGKIPQKPYYISEEHYQRLIAQDSKPQIGDLLMPSICNKGQVWMVDTEEPFYYKDGRVLSISPNREIYNSKYLQYFMREKTLVEYPKLGSGSTFAEFKIFLLKDIDILTPPLSLQNDFAAFVQQIDKSKFEIANSLKRLYNKGMLS